MNIIQQWITGDIEHMDLIKLGDILGSLRWAGYALPAEISYLSYEWNVTTNYLDFWLAYKHFGSDFLA
jgi:hypothetical protein